MRSARTLRTSTRGHALSAAGFTLIELVIFIVVVSIAIVGIFVAFNVAVRGSADPMLRKQGLEIAESLMNEVMAMPFSYCDPQDPANDPANPPTSTASCTGGAGGSQDSGGGPLGPQPPSESRFSPTNPFDNVADYNGYQMLSGIYSLDDPATPISGLGAYTASVSVTRAGAALGLSSNSEALRVEVTVRWGAEQIVLTSYRLLSSPTAIG